MRKFISIMLVAIVACGIYSCEEYESLPQDDVNRDYICGNYTYSKAYYTATEEAFTTTFNARVMSMANPDYLYVTVTNGEENLIEPFKIEVKWLREHTVKDGVYTYELDVNGNDHIKFLANEAGSVMEIFTTDFYYKAIKGSGPQYKIDGHAYVEIGGKKWATMNLGATTVAGSPKTCYGDYFAWGETEPRYTGITIESATSITINGWKSGYYSYDTYSEFQEDILDAAHDAVTTAWGAPWRTPTNEDLQELAKACTGGTSSFIPQELKSESPVGGVYWLTKDQTLLPEFTGIAGALFVDKNDTSKRLFFPATGFVKDQGFDEVGSVGFCWSSVHGSKAKESYYMYLRSDQVNPNYSFGNNYGYAIRPVAD